MRMHGEQPVQGAVRKAVEGRIVKLVKKGGGCHPLGGDRVLTGRKLEATFKAEVSPAGHWRCPLGQSGERRHHAGCCGSPVTYWSVAYRPHPCSRRRHSIMPP